MNHWLQTVVGTYSLKQTPICGFDSSLYFPTSGSIVVPPWKNISQFYCLSNLFLGLYHINKPGGTKTHWSIAHATAKLYIHINTYDELSAKGYTSLPKPDEVESGQMVLK